MWLLLATALLAIPLGLDLYMPIPDENPMTAEKIELEATRVRLSASAEASAFANASADRRSFSGVWSADAP